MRRKNAIKAKHNIAIILFSLLSMPTIIVGIVLFNSLFIIKRTFFIEAMSYALFPVFLLAISRRLQMDLPVRSAKGWWMGILS